MNANELAEIQAFKTEELTMWERNHTATMLRQQQAEIEALNELNTMLKDAIEKRIEMDANRYRFIQNFAEEQHQRAVALESELDRAVELYTDKAIENEALKQQLNPPKSTNLGPWQWK